MNGRSTRLDALLLEAQEGGADALELIRRAYRAGIESALGDLLTEAEMAEHFGVSLETWRRRRELGEVPSWIQVGRYRYYDRTDLEAFKAACRQKGEEA